MKQLSSDSMCKFHCGLGLSSQKQPFKAHIVPTGNYSIYLEKYRRDSVRIVIRL